jgi:hypothetical protein
MPHRWLDCRVICGCQLGFDNLMRLHPDLASRSPAARHTSFAAAAIVHRGVPSLLTLVPAPLLRGSNLTTARTVRCRRRPGGQ